MYHQIVVSFSTSNSHVFQKGLLILQTKQNITAKCTEFTFLEAVAFPQYKVPTYLHIVNSL